MSHEKISQTTRQRKKQVTILQVRKVHIPEDHVIVEMDLDVLLDQASGGYIFATPEHAIMFPQQGFVFAATKKVIP